MRISGEIELYKTLIADKPTSTRHTEEC